MSLEHKGWYSRGYLPHFDSSELVQSINFRLYDSLPKNVFLKLVEENKGSSDAVMMEALEKFLDSGYGECWLQNPDIAAVIERALQYFDGERYRLQAWVIMPNHVHVMINVVQGFRLPDIIKSWKSYTARQVNQILNRKGPFWHRDYYDRYIRNKVHFYAALDYIHQNPVKAGLAESPEDWPFSSANPIKLIPLKPIERF